MFNLDFAVGISQSSVTVENAQDQQSMGRKVYFASQL